MVYTYDGVFSDGSPFICNSIPVTAYEKNFQYHTHRINLTDVSSSVCWPDIVDHYIQE